MKRFCFLSIFISLFVIQSIEADDRVQRSPQKIEVKIAKKESGKLDTTKKFLGLGQSAVTIIAIIAGGIWTYLLFIKKRLRFPRANVENEISHIDLNSNLILLHVKIKVTNIGDVLLSFKEMEIRVQQILPIHNDISGSININNKVETREADEIPWPMLDGKIRQYELKSYEIEPGESDESHFDFIIVKNIKVVAVYSYFQNIIKKGRDLGWGCTSIYKLEN